MEKYKIIVSETFHKELRNIIYYISHKLDSKFTASELLSEIEKTISDLSFFPYRHELVQDSYLHKKGFRKTIIKNYIVFYKIEEPDKTVNIHRILHAKQNWIKFL